MGTLKEVYKKTELEELEGLEGDVVETLMEKYKPLVYATARRLCPALARDEDLLQCGMIGLWRAAEQWDGQRPFSPLARLCIKHEMLMHLRYLSRQVKSLPLFEETPAVPYAQDFSRVELESDLSRKFRSDSQDYQVIAAILSGLPLHEAARQASVPPRRARRRLKRKLGRLLGQEDHQNLPAF